MEPLRTKWQGPRDLLPPHLDEFLYAYSDGAQLATSKGGCSGWRSAAPVNHPKNPMRQLDVYRMIARRALGADVRPKTG